MNIGGKGGSADYTHVCVWQISLMFLLYALLLTFLHVCKVDEAENEALKIFGRIAKKKLQRNYFYC